MATIKAFIRFTKPGTPVKVRLRLSDGRECTLYGVTDIDVIPDHWSAEKEEIKPRILLPLGVNRDQVNARIVAAKQKVLASYNATAKQLIDKNFIGRCLEGVPLGVDLTDPLRAFDIYVSQCVVSQGRHRHLSVMRSILERFILVSGRFTVSGITQGKVREFEGFLKGEHLLQDKYPAVYDQVKRAVKPRGQNTINSKMNILRAFVHHLIRVGYLGVDPFQHYETAPDMYSDPVPLTPREVEALLTFEGLSPALAMVRDMFCLHCYIGCRVGDFVALRRENVQEDILSYIPRKTAGENPSTVYVPLIDKAREIIARYNYPDGRLLPFINVNGKGGYNKRIKELCRLAGLTRQVVVLNTLTRQQQTKPLHDVVSSHTARRTFINSNYAQLQDPALISKMTGHSENSRAFSRYRNIDMDILRSQVKKAFHSTNLAGE